MISLKDKLQKFNTFQNYDSFESFLDLRRYVNNIASKDNFGFQNQNFQNSKKDLVKAGLNFLLNPDYKLPHTHYTYFGRTKARVLLYTLSVFLKTKYRQKFINKNLVKFPNYSSDFVYYPMSLDLERNMLVNHH